MYDLVSFGDIVIDLFFKGETLTFKDNRFQLAVGGKYFVDHFSESLGGGGANVAVGTAHFGLNTAICGKVGENVFKQIIIQKLIKKNVSTEFLLHEKQYLNLSSIYLTEKGERSIVNYQTHDTAFFINPVLMDNMIKTKCVYMGNLPDTPIEEKIIILKRFKENNVKTIL
ncbi:MAG TPA: PfkB family carbohydrate kinase, partial [Candidatus Nitrosocosmicus sp.]|nr:PfkB family carbohydrate kinase [Candidatus Nitrosocosmicus sp.]